jgi:hypothetical protein
MTYRFLDHWENCFKCDTLTSAFCDKHNMPECSTHACDIVAFSISVRKMQEEHHAAQIESVSRIGAHIVAETLIHTESCAECKELLNKITTHAGLPKLKVSKRSDWLNQYLNEGNGSYKP